MGVGVRLLPFVPLILLFDNLYGYMVAGESGGSGMEIGGLIDAVIDREGGFGDHPVDRGGGDAVRDHAGGGAGAWVCGGHAGVPAGGGGRDLSAGLLD